MEAVKICVLLAVTALLSLIIGEKNGNFKFLIAAAGTVVAGSFAVNGIMPIMEYVKGISINASEWIEIVIRALGIAYITEIASSLCKDTGESTLAAGVEFAGKAEIIIISFPLLKQLVEICTELIQS